ncbi:MAG: type II toxin-antitoxin system HicA family toxin [Desulfococcaceae bacterium]
MTKVQKLLSKAFNNPSGLLFREFETILSQSGWTFDRQQGSHSIWYSPAGFRLPIQQRQDGKAKGYQVKQFLEQYGKENRDGQI